MKTLHFSIVIDSPPERVWDTMLAPDTYRQWTAAFAAGSYYEGSWEAGARIRFLGPDGSGMVAEIAANRPYEFLSIQHLGEVKKGVEDTASPAVAAWAPAFENYSFSRVGDSTEVAVDIDVTPDFEGHMTKTWPPALAGLKSICEGPAAQPA